MRAEQIRRYNAVISREFTSDVRVVRGSPLTGVNFPQVIHRWRVWRELSSGENLPTRELLRDVVDLVVHLTPLTHELGDLVVGVHDGRVIAATEELADLG